MKDTIIHELNTNRFGRTLFIMRETEGYLKSSYPVIMGGNRLYLAKNLIRNENYFTLEVESLTGEIITIDIPKIEITGSDVEPLELFFRNVMFFSMIPETMTVKELVFSDLNFELDYNQKVQELTNDELLLVQDNVKVVETNLSLSLLTPIADFKDDYEWTKAILNNFNEFSLNEIDSARRPLMENIKNRCRDIISKWDEYCRGDL